MQDFISRELPLLLLSFGTAFLAAVIVLPAVLHIAKTRQLYDEPVERSSHNERIPRLGGIAIFAGILMSAFLFVPVELLNEARYVLGALLVIFLVGLVDDLSPIHPWQKLLGQLLAICLLMWGTELRLEQFYGLFGFDGILPLYAQYFLTAITLLVIINAFNFIDGINSLAAGLGLVMLLTLSYYLHHNNDYLYMIIALATAGGLTAFLRYNRSPAQLFMGDTGSLLLGLVIGILALRFITYGSEELPVRPALAIGILFLPLYDTLRVFFTRLYRMQSFWRPDRRHIHHLLLDAGLTHMQASWRLIAFTVLAILWMMNIGPIIGPHWALLILMIAASLLTYVWHQRALHRMSALKKRTS